jgi:hypothetical protein
MKTLLALLFAAIFSIWQPLNAQSQNTSSNYIEPGYQLTPILGSAGNFIEIEAGKQLSGGFSFGAVVHFLVSDINRSSGNLNESMSSLWYVGPRLQYSSELNESLSFYGGSTFGVGTTDYEETEFDLSTSGGFLIGVRPEVGIRYQVADILRINLGANVFYGHINSRSNISGAPALRVGFRLGR